MTFSAAEFADDWNSGMLGIEMSKKYGCALETVSRRAKRLGLTPRINQAPQIRRLHPEAEAIQALLNLDALTRARVIAFFSNRPVTDPADGGGNG